MTMHALRGNCAADAYSLRRDDADYRYDIEETTRHEEWLVDEGNRDSFPASDAASSTQPGSIVNRRYAG
jgi:hypothetical protein